MVLSCQVNNIMIGVISVVSLVYSEIVWYFTDLSKTGLLRRLQGRPFPMKLHQQANAIRSAKFERTNAILFQDTLF